MLRKIDNTNAKCSALKKPSNQAQVSNFGLDPPPPMALTVKL